MLKTHISLFFRQLKKNKFFYFVNLAGLSLGMASFLVILCYVLYEHSFDGFHPNSHRVVRVVSSSSRTPIPLGPGLKEIAGVENYARMIFYPPGLVIKDKSNTLVQEKYHSIDSTFFELFSYEFIAGAPASAMQHPNAIVLTESTAKKYFGSAKEAFGKQLEINTGMSFDLFMINGIIKDPPANSQFDFNILTRYSPHANAENWTINLAYTYALLKPNVSIRSFEDEVKKLMSRKTNLPSKEIAEIEVQPLTSIHLDKSKTADFGPHTSRSQLLILLSTGLLIILIACINFINLSTAKSYERLKEAGLRKTLGAEKAQLVTQFLVEAVAISYLAFFVCIGILYLVSPLLSSFTGARLADLYTALSAYAYVVPIFPAIIGIAAGLYPALLIASQPPLQSIKSQRKVYTGAILRKTLVTVQFIITVFLLTGTYIISRQLNYMKKKDLGFDKEQLMVITAGFPGIGKNLNTVRTEFMKNPNVRFVSGALTVPGDPLTYTMPYSTGETVTGDDGDDDLAGLYVDPDFVKNIGMEIISGRSFSSELSTDSLTFILNETAVKKMIAKYGKDWTDPIGKKLNYFRSNATGWSIAKRGIVIGVVKDFNFYPLHTKIDPLAIQVDYNLLFKILIKVNISDVGSTIEFIRNKWKELDINKPFNYTFLDQSFLDAYLKEQRFEKLFSVFSLLSIIISGLGLYGMILFVTQKRLKELSIRKVLGANHRAVAVLLSKEFLKPILVALVITIPLSYYFIQQWLEQFAYRIGVQVQPFAFSAFICMTIALAIIAWHSLQVGRTNPIKHLRED